MEQFLIGTRDKIKCGNRYVTPFETGLCILLYRLSTPSRWHGDAETFFEYRMPRLHAIFKTFLSAVYQYCRPFFSNPALYAPCFPLYAQLINEKSNGAVNNVWGFIDGTMRRMCRPCFFQRLFYSGHKNHHGIKFQSVVTPDGLIACFFGPIPASRHNSYMLAESHLLLQLQQLFHHQPPYTLYGDAAYGTSRYCFGGFPNARPGTPEGNWNREMSRVRESVEWMFNEIVTLWSHIDMKRKMKLFLSPIDEVYTVAAFLLTYTDSCIPTR
jgi:hypothetical protein